MRIYMIQKNYNCCLIALIGYSLNISSASILEKHSSELICEEPENFCGPLGVVVGSYFNNAKSPIKFPLLYASQNSGTTWVLRVASSTAISPDNLPGLYLKDGSFDTVSCRQSLCVAGGSYTAQDSSQWPMLGVSFNKGNNWQYPVDAISGLVPPDYDNTHPAKFDSSNCIGSVCVAGGSYFNERMSEPTGLSQPMLVASTDSGNSWVYVVDSNTVPASYYTGAGFSGISCGSTGDVCIAAGDYQDNSNNYFPMLAVSSTPGNFGTWNYVIESGLLTPSNFQEESATEIGFNSTSCYDSVCVAAGNYVALDNSFYPMLAINTDTITDPSDWSYIVEFASNLPYGFYGIADPEFSGTTCNSNFCAAAGTYKVSDTNNTQYPMIAIIRAPSYTSVSYPIDALNGPLPCNFNNNGGFSATSCTNNICVAVGNYVAMDNIYYPMLATSIDSGITWKYEIDSAFSAFEEINLGGANSTFNSVVCNNTLCYAAGYYTNTDGDTAPLLVISILINGTWSPWTLKVDAMLNLPSDAATSGNIGEFSAAATVPN